MSSAAEVALRPPLSVFRRAIRRMAAGGLDFITGLAGRRVRSLSDHIEHFFLARFDRLGTSSMAK